MCATFYVPGSPICKYIYSRYKFLFQKCICVYFSLVLEQNERKISLEIIFVVALESVPLSLYLLAKLE